VIHTVGPVWRGGGHGEDELLASCYVNSLKLASAYGLKRVAFPAISTGAYGFPPDRAAEIAVRETLAHLEGPTEVEEVIFVCFSADCHHVYRRLLARHGQEEMPGG
jgi:O-acetyl-ADP-ribose deacetylase (regulator of RNase III)